jgi:hypothetical protein
MKTNSMVSGQKSNETKKENRIMKKVLVVMMAIAMGAALVPGQAMAAATATIDVTVSLNYTISISVLATTWNLSGVALSSTSGSTSFTVTNDGDCYVDVGIKGPATSAHGWSLGTAGADTFEVVVTPTGGDPVPFSLTTSDQLVTSSPAGLDFKDSGTDDRAFGLVYKAPTSDTKGAGKSQNFTITLTATLNAS